MTDHESRDHELGDGPDWEALARFLAGESPDNEAVVMRDWLASHPQDRALIEVLQSADGDETASRPGAVDMSDVDVEAALSAVHRRMETAAESPVVSPGLTVQRGGAPRPRHRALLVTSALAAAAIIVAYVTVRRGPVVAPPAEAAPSRLYATGFGQRDSVILGEGSRIILGPDSRLMVPIDYGSTTRSVELLGDAYFEIRHDASKPFSVKVGHALIEDVGTTFTVESDAADTVSVSVLTGSVRLRLGEAKASSGVVLDAGDRGSFTADGFTHAYPHTATAADSAWTTGRLVFQGASLDRVGSEIHRWFGVTVIVADSSLTSRHVTASFNGESVDQVLKIVGLTLGARIERKGDSAFVYSSGGPVAPR
ncbi:MAG TPA: FecR domain-containing protein [Gemmatimonadaceae bacterium]|jgi:transmembrane sensor